VGKRPAVSKEYAGEHVPDQRKKPSPSTLSRMGRGKIKKTGRSEERQKGKKTGNSTGKNQKKRGDVREAPKWGGKTPYEQGGTERKIAQFVGRKKKRMRLTQPHQTNSW